MLASEEGSQSRDYNRERLFLFELCRKLGVMHPDHITAVLSERQILDWVAYANVRAIIYKQKSNKGGKGKGGQPVDVW